MYSGLNLDPESLMQLANFEGVRKNLELIKPRKDSILAQAFESLMRQSGEAFKKQLEKIQKDIRAKHKNFCEGDIQQLSQKQELTKQRLNNGKVKVNGIFQRHLNQIEGKFSKLLLEIEQASIKAKRVKAGQKTETYSSEVSDSTWYKFWTWGSTRTVYHSIDYVYARVNNALEQLEDYVMNSKTMIYEAIQEIVNIEQFRKEIKESVMGLFDLNDDNFDPQSILIPVENAVDRIKIPPDVQINVNQHIDTVRNKFKSGEVRDDEVSSLRSEQGRVVEIIENDIKNEVRGITQKIIVKLTTIQNIFIPDLTQRMENELNQLQQQLQDKERYKARYETLIKVLGNDLRGL
ncbi:hypothetical protein WDW89_06955 [Deltaproteobacteria bacterium TL4]